MKAAGVNIEGGFLRASIASGTLGVIKPLKTAEAALPENREEWPAAIKKALLEWKEGDGIGGVVFGLEFRDFTHNFVELPVASKKEIRQALEFEMEKHLPLPPGEYLHDFLTVESKKGYSRNLVVSIRRDKLDWVVECVRDTGLRLLGVRCTAFEALGEFIRTGAADNTLLHFPGDRSHYIIGVKGRMPAAVKTSYTEKEAAADLATLSDTFTGGIFSVGRRDRSGFSGLDIRDVEYSKPYLLAASGLKRGRFSLNFVPEELAPEKAQYYNRAILGITALAVFFYFMAPVVSYYKVVRAEAEVRGRTEEIKRASKELTGTRKGAEAAEERRLFLMRFRVAGNRYIRALSELSELLPSDTWLTDFSADEKGKVEIEGYSPRTADIIAPIENSPLFKNVEFSSPVSVKDNQERFAIRMEMAR